MSIEWLILIPAAFFAGMVDAAVGGGGLIQIPVLLGQFPQAPVATLFGTNKFSSIAGTSAAIWRFARKMPIPWAFVLPATIGALLGAWFGAAVVAWLPRDVMRPLALVMLIAVAAYTFVRKDFGHVEQRELRPSDRLSAAMVGGILGFYDGFFGPGTGSFLIFAFVRLFGMDFLRASASAKVVNAATNLSALTFFIGHGDIYWTVAAVMAVSNFIGGQLGATLAIRHGAALIRKAFLGVVIVLIAKLAADLIQ